MEIFLLLMEVGNDKQIARRLNLAEHTVRNHIASILAKLEMPGRIEMLIHFWKLRAESNRPR